MPEGLLGEAAQAKFFAGPIATTGSGLGQVYVLDMSSGVSSRETPQQLIFTLDRDLLAGHKSIGYRTA